MLLDQGSEVYVLVRETSPHRELLPVDEHLHVMTGSLTEAVSCLEPVGSADGFLHFAWGGVNREEIDSPAVQAANVEASLVCLAVELPDFYGCWFTSGVWNTARWYYGGESRMPSGQ